jgi:hypothetical protein
LILAQTVEREEVEENEYVDDTNDTLANRQGQPIAASSNNSYGTSKSTSTRRNKAKKNDHVFMQLVDNLRNLGKFMKEPLKAWKKFAKIYKHEADGAYRSIKVLDKLLYLGGLTNEEIVKVRGIITVD